MVSTNFNEYISNAWVDVDSRISFPSIASIEIGSWSRGVNCIFSVLQESVPSIQGEIVTFDKTFSKTKIFIIENFHNQTCSNEHQHSLRKSNKFDKIVDVQQQRQRSPRQNGKDC